MTENTPDRLAAPDPRDSSESMPLPLATVAIPAHNEAAIIQLTLQRLAAEISRDPIGFDWEILVVDDGSTDGTAELVEGVSVGGSVPVRLLRHRTNMGLGCALTTLFRASKGVLVVTIDADLTYDASHVGLLARAWDSSQASVVVASPYCKGGRTIGVPRDLQIRSRLANRYLAAVTRRPLHTFTGMVRAYDGDFVRSLPRLRPGPTANVEILNHAWRQGLTVTEIPATLDWTGYAQRRGRTSMLSKAALRESTALVRDGLRMNRS